VATHAGPNEPVDADGPGNPLAQQMAAKYVWWKGADEALRDEAHFLSMMMTYGTLADTRWMLAHFSRDALIAALRHAPPGIFNGRSWHFWHLRLGVQPVGELPQRRLPT
jgi:hypothetical protein